MRAIKVFLSISISALLAISVNTPAFSSSDLTIDRLTYSKVGKSALSYVNRELKSKELITGRAIFVTNANVPAKAIELERNLADKALTVFSDWYLPKAYTVVMFTEKDGAWADAALAQYGGTYKTTIAEAITKYSGSGNACGFAFATQAHDGSPIWYACVHSSTPRGWMYRQNPPHEYFHLVQNQYGPMPQWLREGSAAFFGAAIGYYESSPSGKRGKEFFRQTAGSFDPENAGYDHNRLIRHLRDLSEEEAVKLYTDLETFDWRRGEQLSHYGLGGLATEVLVGVWGLDKYMEMIKATASQSWESSFSSTYGLSPKSFYAKLTPYLRTFGKKMPIW
jgi:hypothetical protein